MGSAPRFDRTMRPDTFPHLTTTSTIAEVPSYGDALGLDTRARRLADLFHDLPDLPGVLLTDDGRVVSAISRRYYLEMVGSYCGKDLYLSRPIRLMLAPFERLGGALSVEAQLPIREAVARGLARRRELIYEPLVVRLPEEQGEHLEARLVDFEDLLLADSRLSALRNTQMSQILGSVGEGLMLIQPDRSLAAEYSASTPRLLATDEIAGRSLEALLAPRLDAERCRLAGEFVDILFRPTVIEALVATLNPLAKVDIHNPGEARPRTLTFRFVRHLEGRQVRHLLVRIEDITRQEEQTRALAREQESTELRLSLAVALAEADPTLLPAWLTALERQGRAARALDSNPESRRALARELHALKGEAGLLGLAVFRGALHQLETALEPGSASVTLSAPLARLEALLVEARQLIARFRRFGPEARVEPGAAPPTLAALLASLSLQVERLGAELGKPARFVHRVDAALVPDAALTWLPEVLPQLATNALVHGLEPPAQRAAAGKPPVGTLLLAARTHPAHGHVELVFQDDGGGLDLERLAKRAQDLGLSSASPEELARLVFHPGLSTRDGAGEHAGRGLGLDVVKARVEAHGGRVAVASQPGKLCAIRLFVPLSLEVAA